MKKFLYILVLAALCSCADNAPSVADRDELVPVVFKIGGYYGAPFSDLDGSRAAMGQDTPDYDRDLNDPQYRPTALPNGSTVWVCISHSDASESAPPIIKSFVAREGTLYPCHITYENGYPEVAYETAEPIYLKRGHAYNIKMMGPARQLLGEQQDKLYIENGQEVYAHDDRYPQTSSMRDFVINDQDVVDTIALNPMIQQTAKLKFTLETSKHTFEYTEDNLPEDDADMPNAPQIGDTYEYYPIHSLEINESGIVITGLQEHYSLHNVENYKNPEFEGNYGDGTPWNWQLANTYLMPFPGMVRNYLTLNADNAIEMTNRRLVLETCILPCDATSTPIIVGFYLRVNGVPTQFEMMLNRKHFLGGYCYHYKGTLDITNGITVLEWQTIIQELDDIEFGKKPDA